METTNIRKISEVVHKCSPEILTGVAVVGTVINSMVSMKRDANHWKLMYKITGKEIYYTKYLRMTKSNNWLRMHGYPMRRKNNH